eukprot:12270299-Alexandrium_andersonii.AAC.1
MPAIAQHLEHNAMVNPQGPDVQSSCIAKQMCNPTMEAHISHGVLLWGANGRIFGQQVESRSDMNIAI